MTSKSHQQQKQKKAALFGDGETPRSLASENRISSSAPISSLTALRRAGMDPDSGNYGLMAANLFPKKKSIRFSSPGFEFVLEKESRHSAGPLTVLSKGRPYDFLGKFATSSKKGDPKKTWFLPTKSLLLTYRPNDVTVSCIVSRVDHQPPRASFFITLVPEEDILLVR